MPMPAQSDRAIFLIDAHLLDTLIAAVGLGVGTAALVHTRSQITAAQLASTVLASHGIETLLVEVDDQPGPADAERVFDSLGAGWHLHHTGGPDGLAPLMIRAAAARACSAAQASMLDEDRRQLRFDDGTVVGLDDRRLGDRLRLRDVLQLAQLELKASVRRVPDRIPLIAAAAGVDNALRNGIHGPRELVNPEIVAQLPEPLAAAISADLDHAVEWFQFLDGFWLEELTLLAVERAAAGLGLSCEAHSGVKLGRGHQSIELDVLALIRYRPHVLSCTLATATGTAHHKAYEADRRAWQIAGPAARPALVTRLTDPIEIAAVEGIFAEPLESSHVTDLRVFTAADVNAWVQALSAGGRCTSLEAWLAEA